jgi:hypothetical protein
MRPRERESVPVEGHLGEDDIIEALGGQPAELQLQRDENRIQVGISIEHRGVVAVHERGKMAAGVAPAARCEKRRGTKSPMLSRRMTRIRMNAYDIEFFVRRCAVLPAT